MQIANQSIPSNRCQLPSDRANLSIVIGGIQQQKKQSKSGMYILSVNENQVPLPTK